MKLRIFGGLILWLFFIILETEAQTGSNPSNITLVVHGGAGTIEKKYMDQEKETAYRNKLNEALNAGFEVLEKGGTSIEAVSKAIIILENSPLFNAGKGAVFTNEGKNELDASIMDGLTLNAGAVASVTIIKNPILAALEVMNNSPHVMLVGKGAETFAEERNLEIVEPSYFYTKHRYQQLEKRLKTEKEQKKTSGQGKYKRQTQDKFGTVGAVALDQYGNLAAGTSTGGTTNKRWGRVGDSPIIGAGTYADNQSCAVSGTGHGEYFIRSVVAYDISALMKYGKMSLKEAAKEVVNNKLVDLGGEGGIIAVDTRGNYTMTFNSSGMYRGVIKKGKAPQVYFYRD